MPLILTALAVAVFDSNKALQRCTETNWACMRCCSWGFCFMYSVSQFKTALRVLLLSAP